jgi:hypothetical protein
MKLFLACSAAAVIGFGLGNFAYSKPTPMISTNEGGCWNTCKECEKKCSNNDCKDKCWTTNDSCCKGVGGKGVYKMCGCTDK